MNIRFDPLYHPYPSRRSTIYARRGMVATAQPFAAQAGLDILKKGGNAVDAAIAAAACLTVVDPVSNSIGGDSFALVWMKGKLFGLNASGPAPKGLTIEAVRKAGFDRMPSYGMIPITVPGTPASWAALSERFGRLPFAELLEPAIAYAEQGFPVSPTVGEAWKLNFERFSRFKEEQFKPWFDLYTPGGRPPEIGEVWRSPQHAASLRSIADSKAKSFYQGELAERLDRYIKFAGGFLAMEDLAEYRAEWVEPIRVRYRGYDVWELPPNGQGLVALLALNILKGFEFGARDTVDTLHKQIEAVKLAFADGLKYITDPGMTGDSVEYLLAEDYAVLRRSRITERAMLPKAGEPQKGDTVYLAAADEEGNMVSFIQSHSGEFGSGIVVPGTGICMQNRGRGFSLDPSHCNALAPGKKSYHTIIPGFLTRDGVPIGPFGVMCGMIQPQAHVQILMNTIDFSLNPQAALDAPRFRWRKDRTVLVEPGFPDHLAQALIRKGHDIVRAVDSSRFGRGQIIWRDPQTGVLAGGTEPRADGEIAAW